MAFSVIYLTGAPAAGKSSVAAALRAGIAPLAVFDYGAELLRRALPEGTSYEDLRRDSGKLITPEHVAELDQHLVQWVGQERLRSHVLIDTHAVTREEYGFRATPFSSEGIASLDPTLLVCLYVPPVVAVERIKADAQGRRPVDEFEAGFHAGLQAAVAVNYAITLGRAAYMLDATRPVEETVTFVKSRLGRG